MGIVLVGVHVARLVRIGGGIVPIISHDGLRDVLSCALSLGKSVNCESASNVEHDIKRDGSAGREIVDDGGAAEQWRSQTLASPISLAHCNSPARNSRPTSQPSAHVFDVAHLIY